MLNSVPNILLVGKPIVVVNEQLGLVCSPSTEVVGNVFCGATVPDPF